LLKWKSLTKIDSIIVVRENLATIKKQSDEFTNEGDVHYSNKDYDLAIASYERALAIMPDNEEASKKKADAETIQINIKREADRQKSYDNAIANGDKLFKEERYELAKVEFEKARSLKNSEEYPQKRLGDIEKALIRLAAEREKRYAESITTADNFFQQGQYDQAVVEYNVAKSIKPDEKYPQQKIAECNGFIAERLKKLSAQYALDIADADKLYASKIYDKAIAAYRKAEKTKPDETYPAEMIEKISRYIEENSIVDVVKNSDTITSGVSKNMILNLLK